MYKVLNNYEIQDFINKYLKGWSSDIKKVSVLQYDNRCEYLINDHYIFLA